MREFDDIYKKIGANFVANPTLREAYELDGAKTFDEQFSPVSIESQLVYTSALAIYDYEVLVDARAKEIEAQIAAKYPFSIAWYFAKAKEFQLGDNLEFDNKTYKFGYRTIDASKQLVKYVAVRQLTDEATNVTKLKIYVAKDGKAALSTDELNAFRSYMMQIGAAGTHFEFVSQAPNTLRLNYAITYNPQVLSYEGNRLSGGGKPVDEAVNEYLSSIMYGGAFNRTKNVDAIQRADGVVDVVLVSVSMDGIIQDTQSFESPSGFFVSSEITASYTPYYEY